MDRAKAHLLTFATGTTVDAAEDPAQHVKRDRSRKYAFLPGKHHRNSSTSSPRASSSRVVSGHAKQPSDPASMRWFLETRSSRVGSFSPIKTDAICNNTIDEEELRQWRDTLLKEAMVECHKAADTWEISVKKLFSTPAADIVHQSKHSASPFPRSNKNWRDLVPAKGDVGTEAYFSWPMPCREGVLQISRDNPPGAQFFDAFLHLVQLKNTEYGRRAMCVNDWLVLTPATQPQKQKREQVDLPVHEVLNRMLPRPSVFPAVTYLSKKLKIGSIERGNVYPGEEYRSAQLQARVRQYIENRAVLENAIAKGNPTRKGVVDPPSKFGSYATLPDEQKQEADAKLAKEQQATGESVLAPKDLMLFVLLRNWELKRDIERLEASWRNLRVAKRRVTKHRWIHSWSVWRIMDVLHKEPESEQEPEQEVKETTPKRTQSMIERARPRKSFRKETRSSSMDETRPKDIEENSSPSHDGDDRWKSSLYTQRSSSVYSGEDDEIIDGGQATPRRETQEARPRRWAGSQGSAPAEVIPPSPIRESMVKDEGETQDEILREKKDSASTDRTKGDMTEWLKRGTGKLGAN